jgi:hypothetical protein
LIGGDGTVLHRFPTLASALRYFTTHTIVVSPQQTQTLDEAILSRRDHWEPTVTENITTVRIPLPTRSRVEVPYVHPIHATEISFAAQLAEGVQLDTGGLDPSMIPALFSFKNILTGEDRTIGEMDLWLGIDTDIKPGRFYHDPLHSMNSYCVDRIGNDLTYVIVESYQHGKLFQAEVKQTLTGRLRVVEIKDENEIRRLQRMYEDYKVHSTPRSALPPATKVGRNDRCPCGSGKKFKRCHGSTG